MLKENMGKRYANTSEEDEQPRKKCSSFTHCDTITIEPGEILTDISGKKWKLGKEIGTGGFGVIFLVSDNLTNDVCNNSEYICKIEDYTNGPLFVERNCYLRIAKLEMIRKWNSERKKQVLGMPHYVASGSHLYKSKRYRFLILPKYDQDLEQIFNLKGQKFNIKTVCILAMQIIDTLEYIHSTGYVHADVKASNLLIHNNPIVTSESNTNNTLYARYQGTVPLRSCRIKALRKVKRCLRSNLQLRNETVPLKIRNHEKKEANQVYLVDYGLATKYLHSNNIHKEYCTDERKAHAGTILFCSIDAHKGAQSRRSDLESLGYNIIYWLTGDLPWRCNLDNPELIEKKKIKCLSNLEDFLVVAFNNYPKFIYDYFLNLRKLKFYEKPNYEFYKTLFKNAIIENGYNNDNTFDFDNLEKCTKKQKNIANRQNKILAAKNVVRTPLRSNIYVRPLLRKTGCKKKISWSKILVDPEGLIKQINKQGKERKSPDWHEMNFSSNLHNLDLDSLNPTPAMIDVYNRSKQKSVNNNGISPKNRGDCSVPHIDGYTPAMMAVHEAKNARIELYEQMVVNNIGGNRRQRGRNYNKSNSKILKLSPRKTRSITQHSKREISRKISDTQCTKSYRRRG